MAHVVAVHVPHRHAPTVRVECPCGHPFRVAPVSRTARWFRERGLTRALDSLDRDFDARWSVETDDVEFGEALVRQPAARAAVDHLAELGGVGMGCDGKRLTAMLKPNMAKELKDPAHKAGVEAPLRALAACCTDVARSRHFPRRRGHAWIFGGLLAGSLLLLALAIVGCGLWADELVDGAFPRLALQSLLAGLPLALIAVAAAMVPLAGRSSSHREVGVVAVLLFPAVIAAGIAGALAANRFLDPGPATQHRVSVLEVSERRSKDKKYRLRGYTARVASWHAAAADGSATAPENLEFAVREGERLSADGITLLVRVSPGALGAERVLSVLIEPPVAR